MILRNKNSKTLKYSKDASGNFYGRYHSTVTLKHQVDTGKVTFKNGGWITPSTNVSQHFFLDYIGFSNLTVKMVKGIPWLFNLTNKKLLVEISDDTIVSYEDLESFNNGSC